MSSFLGKMADTLHIAAPVTHEQPTLKFKKKILLAVSSAQAQMLDHRTGYFWSELLHAYEVFSRAGFDCDIISESGECHVDEASITKMGTVNDIAKWNDKQFPLHGKIARIRAASSESLQQEVSQGNIAAIYFAGGHACLIDFPHATHLQKLAAKLHQEGAALGAVCHGVAIFDGMKKAPASGIPNISMVAHASDTTADRFIQGKEITGFSVKGEETMPGVMAWIRANNYQTPQEIVSKNGGIWKESSNPMGEYTVQADRIVTGMNPASSAKVAELILTLLPSEPDLPGYKKPTEKAKEKATDMAESAKASVSSMMNKVKTSLAGVGSAQAASNTAPVATVQSKEIAPTTAEKARMDGSINVDAEKAKDYSVAGRDNI